MKTEKIEEFKEEIEIWLNSNKNRQPISLLDLSKLIAIFRRYFILKAKWERKKKINKRIKNENRRKNI